MKSRVTAAIGRKEKQTKWISICFLPNTYNPICLSLDSKKRICFKFAQRNMMQICANWRINVILNCFIKITDEFS